MSDDNKGPWGGSGPNNGDGKGNGKRFPEEQSGQNNSGSQMPPELDEIVKKGQEQRRALMGRKSGKYGSGEFYLSDLTIQMKKHLGVKQGYYL